MKQYKPKSSVIYSGPSLIDGSPIICIALLNSSNKKTGSVNNNMLQTYIIRSDIDPMQSSKLGLDYAICGDCIHRGKPTDNPSKKQAIERTCYVTLYHGPLQVYKAFKRGNYPIASNEDIKAIGNGRMIRLGTYGDPAAVPAKVWDLLLNNGAVGHTGYTHQHNRSISDYTRTMYSADNRNDAITAQSKGYRTFRVLSIAEYQAQGKNALLQSEILCPASEEAGKRVTCIDCKLCTGSGTKAKSIAIVAHGVSRAKYKGTL